MIRSAMIRSARRVAGGGVGETATALFVAPPSRLARQSGHGIPLAALAVLLFLALTLSACGGKKELGTVPSGSVAGSVADPPADSVPAAQSAAPADAASADAPPADAATPSPGGADPAPAGTPSEAADAAREPGTAPAAAPGSERDGKVAEAKAETPVRLMLRSAGRDPDAAQPEPGFTLIVPGVVHDGEPFAVEFAAQGAERMTLVWRGKTVPVAAGSEEPGRFAALLPVPLDEKSRSFPLAVTVAWSGGGEETFKADVPVKKRRYPVQRLKVDSKYVTPPADMEEKIKRDRAEMRAAVTTMTPQRNWTLPMKRPVPGVVTSLYGMRREFNGKPKNPHKGVDYDAREGDPIAAMEGGVVVLASEHYYGGNTVVIDHGLGVLSAYLHMSAFNVHKGQTVSRGDVIGLIGSTGRVTGPHLHLSLYVLGESVNAATCLDR